MTLERRDHLLAPRARCVRVVLGEGDDVARGGAQADRAQRVVVLATGAGACGGRVEPLGAHEADVGELARERRDVGARIVVRDDDLERDGERLIVQRAEAAPEVVRFSRDQRRHDGELRRRAHSTSSSACPGPRR